MESHARVQAPVNGNDVRCVIEVTKKVVWQPCGTSTLKAHIPNLHPSTYSKIFVPGPGSNEAREERADAVQGKISVYTACTC